MTVNVQGEIATLAHSIEEIFKSTGQPVDYNHTEYDWYNAVYSGLYYRRAHLQIVDKRSTHGIYILHSTVFPHYTDPAPIWGFDAVCGPNKITGAFHDFSLPAYPEHRLALWWKEKSSEYVWNKPRQLPDWAQPIFSSNMIAAGNVNTEEEVTALKSLAIESLNFYMKHVGEIRTEISDHRDRQNFYCKQQKQNPHVINSMVAMGYTRPLMEKFLDQVLFPEG